MIQLLILLLFNFQGEPADAERQLENLFKDHCEYTLQVNPLFATGQGVYEWNHRLPESGLNAVGERKLKRSIRLNMKGCAVEYPG